MRNIDNDPRYLGTDNNDKRVPAEKSTHSQLARNGYETLDQAKPGQERKGLNPNAPGDGSTKEPDWLRGFWD